MGLDENLQKQLIQDLLIESFEGLDRYDRYLLDLEKGEGGAETLNGIFRVIHTIKGTSGCLGLTRIESIAHVGENLLSLMREGRLPADPERVTGLLKLSDALRAMLQHLEREGDEGQTDHTPLMERLTALQGEEPAGRNSRWGLFEDEFAAGPAAAPEAAASAPTTVTDAAGPTPVAPLSDPMTAARTDDAANRPAAARASVADSAIRVDVGQLDKLMNLVGELVLARNQIIQFAAHTAEDSLAAASQRLNIITTELQESVMKTRMQPIGNIWSKFPRVVRDLASELGKQVQLVMEGQETELDRTIIEAIKDPLTHIIRNSVDHGIELPAERTRAGKLAEGRLEMRAFHEGGQVNIEIWDDGKGIDRDRVLQKAVQRGIVSQDAAARITDREVWNLIFHPGFSTAEKVTNVSGRGVGMDVVKTNIEKIGGSVDVSSEPGRGTTIKIKIPLTLAIIPALIVTSGGERFAIPQVSLLELVRLEAEQARKGIEDIQGAPVYRLRGSLLPLVSLNDALQLPASEHHSDVVNIVVLQADGRPFGLIVDVINDTEEIVVKPLGKQLKGLDCFAGATIMGDGRVALILDVLGLAQTAHVVSESRDRSLVDEGGERTASADAVQTLLVFSVGEHGRMALPLSMVARLEEFPRAQVERAGEHEVVQYRSEILPLLHVEHFVTGGRADGPPEDPMQVVVYRENDRSVGLVVSRIQDIVQERLVVQRRASARGVLGSAVIQGRVTELLDVAAVIRAADPSFHETPAGTAA